MPPVNHELVLLPLGSGGWIPLDGRETLSIAFWWGHDLVIMDAGTGISRLLELRRGAFSERWSRLRGVHLFLTHYHFDHIAGIFWLPALIPTVPVTVYAPGRAVYGAPARDVLDAVFKKPYAPRPMSELIPGICILDLDPPSVSLTTGLGALNIAVRINTRHSDPSVSLRFGDYFALVTDTPPEQETIDFVRGVKVLLHESWFDSSGAFEDGNDSLELHADGPHTGSFGAGLVAVRAGVKRLYLVHHNPERADEEIEADARMVSEKLGLDCRPLRDLEVISIGR